ncbi:translation initiation factor IF-2 [Actinoplanes sp. SE50]|uniref:hypothetical protein n=1 Tax=unclassified Actinoplanes TaxID=2626549 RepID=UPI00023EC1A1|nr:MULTISPECIES: hypothetical protein [unclassified Actinoplanes]AEV87972.1 Translation initiation factor IF-2 [Actinoplanes sp. SE50/110]ATO86376.1 translation initiation factor IF-2 [Actinoplanes sp. SE50]SLM03791.1 uncharacterized protein ACSP50_7090 [Actinoplanes sp. SE50/110]
MSQDPYPGQPFPGVPNPNVPPQEGLPPTQPFPGAYPQPQQPAYGQQPPPYGQQQPAYGQQPPAYGQQQPAYGQPAYGQPQPSFPPIPPAPKKSKALPITLISIAIVLVLCVGGVVAINLLAKDDKSKGTATATSTSSTKATEGGAAKPAADITVVEPKTLGGRPKLTTAEFATITKTMQEGLKDGYPGATKSLGAFYGTPVKKNMVMTIAVAAPISDPELELDRNFTSMSTTGFSAEHITAVDTGSFGGSAKCGDGKVSSVPVAVCAWSDSGSVGMLVWYYTSKSAAEKQFPAIRAEIEKVG